MPAKKRTNQYFYEYFAEWIELYKQGAVRPVTYQKYMMTLQRLTEFAPTLKICDLDKRSYQILLNNYAETHEKQTTMDFHHHLKSAILDAIDEGLLTSDPTRKVIIKGKIPVKKKLKFLSQHELQSLLKNLILTTEPNWDWFILLIAKTGLRFSEALALTPNDFDFVNQKIKITKTWDYKSVEGGFGETKNLSSIRTISIDIQLSVQFFDLTNDLEKNEPIFVRGRVFNSTVNNRLNFLCRKAGIPIISIHSLRHTHASLLIFAGVSVASVAKRLGHSSVTTTQETYLHIIQELENQDHDKIMKHLSMLI
ncbi:Tyrosine recombinase XerC [Methanimicrococcus hongohii]|uniref:Tyrosine recombinase XerC n=1 Tax=Methanimicrococcus hongohii TaxID=3028295 RepID=A0AA96V313_9EURY|nr:tyrosine-type recombinase/integrase [Methanimicrococcus sp. Hf6]WNY24093.1 Tyrosine recombinase XerC [Methanimicrococcus sp. Hf6]